MIPSMGVYDGWCFRKLFTISAARVDPGRFRVIRSIKPWIPYLFIVSHFEGRVAAHAQHTSRMHMINSLRGHFSPGKAYACPVLTGNDTKVDPEVA